MKYLINISDESLRSWKYHDYVILATELATRHRFYPDLVEIKNRLISECNLNESDLVIRYTDYSKRNPNITDFYIHVISMNPFQFVIENSANICPLVPSLFYKGIDIDAINIYSDYPPPPMIKKRIIQKLKHKIIAVNLYKNELYNVIKGINNEE